MVVHEDIRMQPAVTRSQQFPEQLQIPQPVTIVEDAGSGGPSSLDHVLRDNRQVETGKAGRERDPVAWATQSVRAVTAFGLLPKNQVGK